MLVYGWPMTSGADGVDLANLLYRYAELVDTGDFDGVGALFARARVHMAGPSAPAVNGESVAAIMRRFVRLYDGVPATRHLVTNTIIEFSADGLSAATRSYYTVLQILASPVAIVSGRYHDRFARDVPADGDGRGAWHFTERIIHVDAVGDVSGHLTGHLPVSGEI